MRTLSRRRFFQGRWQQAEQRIRPPWSYPAAEFIAGCDRCNKCVEACETGVLTIQEDGYPACDFQRAECSFCRHCLESCPANAFDQLQLRPWANHIVIGQQCLALQNIECRSCQDYCDVNAIRFSLRKGGVAFPVLTKENCSGCGACIKNCPSQAIVMTIGSLDEQQ